MVSQQSISRLSGAKSILAIIIVLCMIVIIPLYNYFDSYQQSEPSQKPIKQIVDRKNYTFPGDPSITGVWPSFEPPPLSNGPILKRNLFTKAQRCLRDSPFAPIKASLIPVLGSNDYELPSDIEQHYIDLLNYTVPMRQIKVSSYAGYNGPWMENVFISKFCCDKPLSFFGGLVPLFVQWTDLFHVGVDKKKKPSWYRTSFGQKFFSMLRKDVIYVAVVQHMGGIFLNRDIVHPKDHWNILILSAGGSGHVPVPLFLKELPFDPNHVTSSPRKNLLVFAGSDWGNARKNMVRILKEMHDVDHLNFSYQLYLGPNWQTVMKNATLNLAPRGFGRTSFRLTECIQMGLIPVYLYDDHEWTPYRGSPAHVSNFGFSVNMSDFRDFVYRIVRGLEQDPNYLKIPERTAKMKQFRESHYTLKGSMDQIQYFFQDDPRCDLACQLCPRY